MNRVIIRVWKSRVHESSAGHASLQTHSGSDGAEGIYASFWPILSAGPKGKLISGSASVTSKLNLSPSDDIAGMGREPDFIIYLYGLHVPLIEEAFLKFRASGAKWGLLAPSLISFPGMDYTHCSGLVFHLLSAGGIQSRSYYQEWLHEYTHLLRQIDAPEREVATVGAAAIMVVNPLFSVISFFAKPVIKAAAIAYKAMIGPEDIAKLASYAERHERIVGIRELNEREFMADAPSLG